MAGSEPDPERETSSTHRGAPLSSALGETTAEPPRPNSPSEARTQTSCQESSLPSSTQGPKSLPAQGLFGRYELLGDVNQGGMGIVYKARDTALGRVVALKMLKTGTLADQEEVKRFYREARAVAKLKHPHIVPIYDVGQHQGLHYFTMEYVPGGTVASHLTRFQADIAAAVGLMEKVARAVQYAHQNGILHRDLKPTNILIDENGEPRVSDLGLAKLFYAEGELLPPEDENAGAVLPPVAEKMPLPAETLSQATGIVGTPPYMSPEQVAVSPSAPK